MLQIVDDVQAALEGGRAARSDHRARPRLVTASIVDPFGNVLGIMCNRHYLAVLGNRDGQQ